MICENLERNSDGELLFAGCSLKAQSVDEACYTVLKEIKRALS